MVGGTPKPFACTSEGCTMTFTNEDHLNVHQRKHEMVLNFGLKNTSIVADQTPTPTRFLRNCEEVGLFQDLQNVNPFEETFRKATELVKTGSLPVPVLPEDDTLHTPHIFPHLPQENISLYSSKKIEKVILTTEGHIIASNDKILCESEKTETVLTLSINHDSPDHIYALSPIVNHKVPPTILICGSPEPDHMLDSKEEDKVNDKLNTSRERNLNVHDNKNKIIKAKYRRYTGNINLKNNVYSKNNSQNAKSKLHQLLLQNKKQIQSVENKALTTTAPVIVLQNMPVVNRVPILQTIPITKLPILPKMESLLLSTEQSQTKAANKNSKPSKTKSKHKKDIDINSYQKQDLLERNRAAAIRCRERKKVFIDSLQQQLNVSNKEKQSLTKENVALKKEILHLKTLLLAHKECPVTKAMRMGQSIPIGIPHIVGIPVDILNNDIKIETKPPTIIPISEIKTISMDASPKPNVLVWED